MFYVQFEDETFSLSHAALIVISITVVAGVLRVPRLLREATLGDHLEGLLRTSMVLDTLKFGSPNIWSM